MLADSSYTKAKRFLLLGIPLFYLWLSYTYLSRLLGFYLTHNDPIYAYLMNGTNLAGGHMAIGIYQHPGTPMECLIALIVFIKHFINGQGHLYQDVILHPESYLYTISIIFSLLLGLVTLLTGNYIFRHTTNIGLALLFQLTPLFNDRSFFSGFLPVSECVIIIVSTFFMAYIYINIFSAGLKVINAGKDYKKYIIIGLFSALLIASKFTAGALLLFGLFLAQNSRQRLLYLASVLVFFVAFTSPLIFKFKEMCTWVFGLFMHDGHYGEGKADILNPAYFKTSLASSFTTDYFFSFVYLIVTLASIVCLMPQFRKTSLPPVYKRGIIGLWLSFTIIIFMVSKHYLFVYYIPMQCCFTLAILLAFKIFSSFLNPEFFHNRGKKVLYSFSALVFILLAFTSIKSVYGEGGNKKTVEGIKRFIETKPDDAIITTNVYGTEYIQPSLYFGFIYSDILRPLYFQFAMKAYPKSYIYSMDGKNLIFWDVYTITPEIFRQYPKTLVYFKFWGKANEADEINAMNDLCSWDGKKIVDYKKVYEDTATWESFYEISSDTATIKKMFTKTLSIKCDLEKLNADRSEFLTDNAKYTVKGASICTSTQHHSGNNSIRMDSKIQYALNTDFEVSPGDFVTISLWKKNVDNMAFICLTSDTDNAFNTNSRSIINSDNTGWDQLLCQFRIPNDYKGKIAHFFINYTGQKESWFDDLEINVYKVKVNP